MLCQKKMKVGAALILTAMLPVCSAATATGGLDAVYLDLIDGEDTSSGEKENPVKTFARAKELLAYDGTIYLVGSGSIGTGKEEVWSLPKEEYGDAKLQFLGGDAAAMVRVQGKLTLEDIVIEGSSQASTSKYYMFYTYLNSDAQNSATIIFSKNTVVRNASLRGAVACTMTAGGTIILDGAEIYDVKAGNGIFECVSNSTILLKRGTLRTKEANGVAIYGARSDLVHANGTLSVDGIIRDPFTTNTCITVQGDEGYRLVSAQKDGADWQADKNNVYAMTREPTGNYAESLFVQAETAESDASFVRGDTSITGSIETYGGAITVDANGTFSIESAATRYVIDKITVDGVAVQGAQGKRIYTVSTAEMKEGSHRIEAYFVYTAEFSASGSGSLVVRLGHTTKSSGCIVRDGQILTLTATPAANYSLTELTINGKSVLTKRTERAFTYTYPVRDLEDAATGTVILATFVMNKEVETEGVSLAKKTISLKEGTGADLTATVLPLEAADKTVSWSTTDPRVANVGKDGHVVGLSAGTATITATTVDGHSAQCRVTVSKVPGLERIEIGTTDELVAFTNTVKAGKSYAGKAVYLTADIDVSSVCSKELDVWWTPIGTEENPFTGVFDGNGHTISGLYMFGKDDSYLSNFSLFGYVTDGVVRNLTVAGEFDGYTNGAGVVARANYAGIFHCVNLASVTAYRGEIGGIAAIASNTVIADCENYGEIRTTAKRDSAGIAYSCDCLINCYNGGDVSAPEGASGIAGRNSGIVTGCVNTGSVTASVAMGMIYSNSGIISNSYNTGTVYGTVATGITSAGTIENCYDIGIVKNKESTSGGVSFHPLVGVQASVTNSFYLDLLADMNYTGAVGPMREAGGKAKSEEELKSASFLKTLGSAFVSDRTDTPLNNGYPILAWQQDTEVYSVVLEYGSTEENDLKVLSGGIEQQSGSSIAIVRNNGSASVTVAMSKVYTVENVTVGSGSLTLTGSQVVGATATYEYNLTGVMEDTALTVTLKAQDVDAGAVSYHK
ncbi:MAG: Ig-like domain-containing protein [Oscillospiraceae bacterium]|nr:Ig-like domain-containing protein [Oscillospiraceae bacterium]